MDGGWGIVRTTEGEITITDDSIRIRRTPKKFLRGQVARWRNEERWQKIKAVLGIIGLLLFPLFVANNLYSLPEMTHSLAVFASLVIVVLSLLQFWMKYLRKRKIPLTTIENVTVDTARRELTITHHIDGFLAVLDKETRQKWLINGGLLSLFAKGESNTTLTLRTADDVRKVRTIMRTRGIVEDIDTLEPEGKGTETVYRVNTENGVVFCECCDSQVSPNDGVCPSCGYALRVAQPLESDSRELTRET